MKYKVSYHGFAYVEADSQEEAEEKAMYEDDAVYSNLPGNVLGQICPQFFLIWWGLCLVFIPVFDWMWWAVCGGEKPHYK